VLRPTPTVLAGVFGGIAVGATSAGSGTLILVSLLLLHPTLSLRSLVGTDLMQAIPLVGAAAAAHLLFGDVQFALSGQLLLGALPAVCVGALLSSGRVAAYLKPALALMLTFPAMKLLGAPTTLAALAAGATVLLTTLTTLSDRRARAAQHG
jgi:uncharacterized membrane protein YfcA